MAKMGRVSGFWRFLGKYLGTGPKIPYWEPTGETPWISGPEYIPTLIANRDAYWASLFSSVSLNKDSSRIVKRVSMHIATVPSLLAGGDMSRSGTGSR
jgi:hypothetical protein